MSHCSPSPAGTGHWQMPLGHLCLAPCSSRASDSSDKAVQHPPAHAPAAAAGSRARLRGGALRTPIALGPQSGGKGVQRGEVSSPLLSLLGKPVVGTVAGRQVSVPPRAAALRGEAAAAREKCPSWEMVPEKSPRSSSGSGAAGRAELSSSRASLRCKCTF